MIKVEVGKKGRLAKITEGVKSYYRRTPIKFKKIKGYITDLHHRQPCIA